MPIRINLLADQLAAEEARRKDPVKLSGYLAGVVVVLVLGYWGSVRMKVAGVRGELAAHEQRWASLSAAHTQVTNNQATVVQLERKMAALKALVTNRFMWGPPLDALQRVTVSNVQVVRIKVDQVYKDVKGRPPITNGLNVIKGTPSGASEKITLSIDARDYGRPADLTYLQFRKALSEQEYFQKHLVTNGVNLSAVSDFTPDETDPSRSYLFFTLECRFPEKLRQ